VEKQVLEDGLKLFCQQIGSGISRSVLRRLDLLDDFATSGNAVLNILESNGSLNRINLQGTFRHPKSKIRSCDMKNSSFNPNLQH